MLDELERRVVRRPGLGPDGLGLVPELLGPPGVAGVIGAEGGLEQLAVSGGQVGGGFPDQVGELAAAGGQPVQRGGVDVGTQEQAVIGAGQAKWRSRISELSECLGRERWFFFDLAPLGGCHG